MKTAVFPPLRAEPELRDAAESVLQEGETLSSFVEQSIRSNIERRRSQAKFIERGLAARAAARRTGEYASADAVLARLGSRLERAKSAVATPEARPQAKPRRPRA